MAKYKLTKNESPLREDGVFISNDLENRDYREYLEWVNSGGVVTPYIVPDVGTLIPKSLIIERLHEAGKLQAAKDALDLDIYARERWYAPDRPFIYADNVEAITLLGAIGADAKVILG